jgi:hypothetical protein
MKHASGFSIHNQDKNEVAALMYITPGLIEGLAMNGQASELGRQTNVWK